MSDKTPLLEFRDDDSETDKKASKPFRKTTPWYFRQKLRCRSPVLISMLSFICCMLIVASYLNCYSMLDVPKFKTQTTWQSYKRINTTALNKDVANTRTSSAHLTFEHTTEKITADNIQGYIVYTNHCRIANHYPYVHEVMQHFTRVLYKRCQLSPPLTKVYFDPSTKQYVLSIDPIAFPTYNIGFVLSCHYVSVKRVNDSMVVYSPTQAFATKVQLPSTVDSIIVQCRTETKKIYVNGHPTIPERKAVRKRLDQWAQKDRGKRVPSVLMIGIDSISRVNLIRAMPKTTQYLYDNDWFELAGYNKIGDNTFPNVMALMVGHNLTDALKLCVPYKVDGLTKCEFMWKLYKQHGYVTAYGEDAIKINTFNYHKMGFQKPPVDYYLRPYLTAAEKLLDTTIEHGLPRCVGYETEAEHVYNYAMEFAQRFRNDSFFGFFWTNTHSHSDISQTSSMDDYLKDYLTRLVSLGIMENSVVIFLSDHGVRFGPTRATWSGHLEERLPFLFIWLPPFIRKAHPEFVEALRLNRNRLTTPYDLHMTLKHILSLSGRAGSLESLGNAKGCPNCQSLFQPVSLSRGCEDVGIEDHWCTCWEFKRYDENRKLIKRLAMIMLDYMNNYVRNFRNGSLAHRCQPLKLRSIKLAYKAHLMEFESRHIEIYWLTLYTLPNKVFYEGTIRYNPNRPKKDYDLLVKPSRLTAFTSDSDCVKDLAIEAYCCCF